MRGVVSSLPQILTAVFFAINSHRSHLSDQVTDSEWKHYNMIHTRGRLCPRFNKRQQTIAYNMALKSLMSSGRKILTFGLWGSLSAINPDVGMTAVIISPLCSVITLKAKKTYKNSSNFQFHLYNGSYEQKRFTSVLCGYYRQNYRKQAFYNFLL